MRGSQTACPPPLFLWLLFRCPGRGGLLTGVFVSVIIWPNVLRNCMRIKCRHMRCETSSKVAQSKYFIQRMCEFLMSPTFCFVSLLVFEFRNSSENLYFVMSLLHRWKRVSLRKSRKEDHPKSIAYHSKPLVFASSTHFSTQFSNFDPLVQKL